MKRMKRLCVMGWVSLSGFLVSGCTNQAGMEFRDAAISAAATFIEQQTLELLEGAFDPESQP